MKEKEQTKSFCRQHWCLCVYVILAVIGITVPAWAYMQPCEDQITTYTQPADVFILIDASKSLKQESWKGEKDAAMELIRNLNSSDSVKDLQVGFLTFTGHWEHKNEHAQPVLRDITNLGTDINDVTGGIDALGDAHSYLQIGTNFHEPLSACKSQLEDYGRPDSYKLCVLMTDGEDMSFTYRGSQGSCARGCSYPLETAAIVRNISNTEILAIYSGKRKKGRDTLYAMSSCTDYQMPVDDCMYFTQVDDFPDLRSKLDLITANIIDEINYEHVRCVKGPWLGFLLLLVPLLVMLMLPHCLRCCGAMKKVKKVRIINDAPKVPPPPPPSYDASVAGTPATAPPVEKKIKKAYKWDVDLGSYIRSGGNIKPDWGSNGFVPKSAPTEGERRKVTVGDDEQADGYEYEYVEVEQTLEEWAEEKMTGAAGRFCTACYWFWCCCGMCCCYKKEEDDGMAITLLTPADALSGSE